MTRAGIIFFSLLGIMFGHLQAQDPVFSQYFNSPALINPAALGDFNGKTRLTSAYRNQWSSVIPSFKTTSAGLDLALRNAGLGMSVLRDNSGGTGLTHLNVLLGFAFRKSLRQGYLSLGFQGGIIQKSFDPANFSFGSQYDPDKGFDPELPSGEFFPQTSIILPDLQSGFTYCYLPNEPKMLESLKLEASFAHLNRPRYAFLNGQTEVPMRMGFHASAAIRTGERVKVSPRLLWMQQGVSRLFQAGVGVNYELDREVFLDAGMAYRWGDAVIPYMGLSFNQFQVAFSYDWTLSSLNAYNRGQGALEVNIGYVFGSPEAPISDYSGRKGRLHSDRDGDGIPDTRDRCPDLAGSSKMKGCPDSDGDGLADTEDRCPYVSGPLDNEGCPFQDRDGDGVIDAEDACPDEAGLPAFRGCPDSDFDGLPDHVDRCPYQPGPKERAGCPGSDIDADGDGVPDKIDACPTVAGLAEHQGCPDADGDGVSDFEDRCPLQKGSKEFGGCPTTLQDADNDGVGDEVDDCPCAKGQKPNGCPDNQALASTPPDPMAPEFGPVEFETAQALVRPEFFPMLDELASHLLQNPELHVHLAGHTDTEGSNSYNVALSHNRSLAIGLFLQKKGVASHRISMSSYGEYLPKTDNTTPFGRARNRRVEISISK